jgi:hypothetical protein
MQVFQLVYPCLQPSAAIAVFSLHLQPLADMQEALLKHKMAVNIRVEELFTREH